ncbi:hypothetical protein RYX36_016997, partial [Vicia faba]
ITQYVHPKRHKVETKYVVQGTYFTKLNAAIAATVTIPPDAQRNVTFSLAWDIPEVMFPGGRVYNKRYTKFYGTKGDFTADIAHDAIIDNLFF